MLSIAGFVIGILSTIVGIGVSYYFYKQSLREKEPCWNVRSNNLIKDYTSQINQVKVLYNDQLVDNLTVSRIIFWNRGSLTIDSQDIQTKNRLRIITVNGALLLDVSVSSQNNLSNQVSVDFSEIDNCAYINFDYLDKDNGVNIQVIHTGISNDDILLSGDIKGAKLTKVQNDRKMSFTRLIIQVLVAYAELIIGGYILYYIWVSGFSIVSLVSLILIPLMLYFFALLIIHYNIYVCVFPQEIE